MPLIFSADCFDSGPGPGIVLGSDLPRRGREQRLSRTHMKTGPEVDSREAAKEAMALRVLCLLLTPSRIGARVGGHRPMLQQNKSLPAFASFVPSRETEKIRLDPTFEIFCAKRSHSLEATVPGFGFNVSVKGAGSSSQTTATADECKNYQTKPCARSASSMFKVQSSKFWKLRNEANRWRKSAHHRRKHHARRDLRQNYETKPIDSPAHFTPGGLKSALQ